MSAPILVRKIGRWWLWYCQLPDCLDHGPLAHSDPGCAADAGRDHYYLWHTHN